MDNNTAFFSFLKQFDTPVPEYIRIGNDYYLDSDNLSVLNSKISEKINRSPFSISLYFGRYDKTEKVFQPSFPLLEMLDSDHKVIVSKKGEWLFLCKRNILSSSIINFDEIKALSQTPSGFNKEIIVVNQFNEVLGLGKLAKGGEILIKNTLDRGNFLRRERR